MTHLTPTRGAACAAAVAVLGAAAPPALGFYLTIVACAGLMGAALSAYLAVVDESSAARLIDVAACTVAGLLVVVDAAIRFPAVLEPTAPAAAARLAELAFALTAAATITPIAAPGYHALVSSSWRRQTTRAAAQVSARSARLIRRIADVS
jgi:hypothetical protein